MDAFKNLEWFNYNDEFEGLYAAPDGLKWRYSIIKHTNQKIEFAILDQNYEYEIGFPKFYQSINAAKEAATKHYLSLITQIAAPTHV